MEGKTVILARFIPIRELLPFVAGAGEMKLQNLFIVLYYSAIIWVTSITLLGYFLGNIEWVKIKF